MLSQRLLTVILWHISRILEINISSTRWFILDSPYTRTTSLLDRFNRARQCTFSHSNRSIYNKLNLAYNHNLSHRYIKVSLVLERLMSSTVKVLHSLLFNRVFNRFNINNSQLNLHLNHLPFRVHLEIIQ